MAERYEKVFSQAENLYCTGAPLVLEKGALLKDGLTQNIVAQLKFKSIQDKVIKAVTVKILSYDTLGKPLKEETQYQYLDLFVKRDESFGEQVPIIVVNSQTRSYQIIVSQVIFVNNTIWTGNEVWTLLDQAPSCNKVFQEPELCKQYAIEFGSKKGRMHSIQRDLFICACGAINRLDEEKCHQCGLPKEKLLNFNKNELQKNCQIRLEKEEAERLRRVAEQERKKQKYRKLVKKLLKIGIPLIIVLLACGFAMDKYQELDSEYQYAMSQMEEGYYENAIEEFKALGNFKDSPERVKQAQDAIDKEKAETYKEAKALLEAGDALGAEYKFGFIPGYKDADELCAVADEQERVNDVYMERATNTDEYECLSNNAIQEVMQGAWMLVGPYYLKKIVVTDDGKATADDGTIYQWKLDDNDLLFYEYDEEDEVSKKYEKYRTHYAVSKGAREGYYIGEKKESDYSYLYDEFEIQMMLLPVDSDYVKRLQAYVANEEE